MIIITHGSLNLMSFALATLLSSNSGSKIRDKPSAAGADITEADTI